MKKLGFLISCLSLLIIFESSNAWALRKIEKFNVGNSKTFIKKKTPRGLRVTRLERGIKNDLIRDYILDRKKFREIEGQANSDLHRSYLDEVTEALKGQRNLKRKIPRRGSFKFYRRFMKNRKVELARQIAVAQAYRAIRNHWKTIRDTEFNVGAGESWKKSGSAFTQDYIQRELSYLPKANKKEGYVFALKNFGYIEIAKNLRRGRVLIDIGSRNSQNALEPGAEDIRAASGSAPSPAPTFNF